MGNIDGKQQKDTSPFFARNQSDSYTNLKDDISKTCKCSYKTRLIGYGCCLAVGWTMSIIAALIFFLKHDVVLFAVLYSFGQIISIAGSCFLAGPKQQAKDMFKKTRLLLTILYLGSTLATIILAIVLPQNLRFLVIITLIVQFVSYFLYTLSYVPFGRKLLKKACECLLVDDK